MPIFTQPISQQNTAYSGGIHFYPSISQTSQYSIVGDFFQRETLNPSNLLALYTTNAASSGTIAIPTGSLIAKCTLTTAASLNDYVGFRSSQFSCLRIAPDTSIDARTIMTTTIVFAFATGGQANAQAYIGLLKSLAADTAIPTTAKSQGVYIDTSVDANIYLTAANGTTQRTKSCGASAANTYYKLVCQQTADNSLTLNLYSSSTYGNISTSIGSLTVTDAGYDDNYEIHVFLKTINTSAKALDIYAWTVAST